MDETLNTFVIDSLCGGSSWWYYAHYDGGKRESNAHRMDLFPYKNGTIIGLYKISPPSLARIFASFCAETSRVQHNDGRTIIPMVTIEGPSGKQQYRNVAVRAHNLRDDIFQTGVITAADVILSLADQGQISYDLTWCETVRSADVQAYYFTRLGKDMAYGMAGFVYETGERSLRNARTNMMHVTSDLRVIFCPEYLSFRWINLGRPLK